MTDAVVVGSGPNGLAAAVLLARAGLRVEVFEAAATPGGGARSAETTLPGFRHDVCAAAHPMGVASAFFRAFDLARHGVAMAAPEASYAHPLDGGRAGIAWTDLDRTADGLGVDGRAWHALFAPLVARWPALTDVALSDLRSLPADPVTALRLGLRVLEQAGPLGGLRFRGPVAPALLAGVAGHAVTPLRRPVAAGVGLLLAALAHGPGWPVAVGGTQAITDALVADLAAHGGIVRTATPVTDLRELPRAAATLLDTTPAALARIAGGRLPDGYRRALARFRHGNAVCKVDFALSGPVPWANPDCARAGTLHLVGDRVQAEATAAMVAAGRHPAAPYTLVIQPGVVDPSRAPAGRHTLYAYAHVPPNSTVDMADAVTAQVARFAPGFPDLVLARASATAADLARYNPNYVGGDIAAGAITVRQTVFRPTPRWNPYRTALPGVYLCSSSTPPGPGVHGMCGLHAARHALADRFGVRTPAEELLRA